MTRLLAGDPGPLDLAHLIATEVLEAVPSAAFVALEVSGDLVRLGTVFDASRRPACREDGLVSVDEVRDAAGHLDVAADAAALLVLGAQTQDLIATGFGSPTVLDLRKVLSQAAGRTAWSSRHQRGSGL